MILRPRHHRRPQRNGPGQHPDRQQRRAAGDLAAVSEAPTMEVHIRAILELPPPPPPTPRNRPPPRVQPGRRLDFCADADPGQLCKVPFPAPPTPTPYPSCANMEQLTPGDWCVWPTQEPARRAANDRRVGAHRVRPIGINQAAEGGVGEQLEQAGFAAGW